MAQIRARGRGYSVIMDVGLDANGRRKQKRFTVKGTRADAEKKLRELLRTVDSGAYTDPGKVTVADFLRRWLNEYATPQLGPRTSEGYESIVRTHLIPSLGSVRLASLKPEDIQRFYADCLSNGRCDGRGKALSPLTVRHVAMCLHRALEHAVKWGLLPRNVADAVDAPKFQRKDMNILNESDIERVLEVAKATPYYVPFFLAMFTGLRRSEFLALKWGDVDLLTGQLSVARTIHQVADNSLVFRPPKTLKGRRTVAMTPSTIMLLRSHRDAQDALKRELCGEPLNESDMVCSHADGTPLKPDSLTCTWRALAKRVGLGHIRLHDLRHSHASLMLKQGVHPKIVAERLGHSSVMVTLDTYSHVAPGLQEAAAARFDESFNLSYNRPAASDHVTKM